SEANPPTATADKGKGKAKADVSPAIAERFMRKITRLDWLLAGIVLVLAFMLASFTGPNSDYWLHLALRRFLAEGNDNFGLDPFAYTTGEVYCVNHSWLFDWLLYGLTMLCRGPEGGGAIVAVVLKAIGMALLAAVLLSIRRPGQSLFAPVLCVGLAV